MIPFSHGIKRRVSALLCAVALVFALAFFPVRARAAAATAAAVGLTAVGFAVTVAAFLNASGVFPYEAYNEGENITFGAWSQEQLGALIEQYNATNPVTLISSQTIKAYATGATICVASSAWNALRDFAQWLKDTFALGNNQTGAELGVITGGVPIFDYGAGRPTTSECYASGSKVGTTRYGDFKIMLWGARRNTSCYLVGYVLWNGSYRAFCMSLEAMSFYDAAFMLDSGLSSISGSPGSRVYNGTTIYFVEVSDSRLIPLPDYPIYSSFETLLEDYFTGGGVVTEFSGVLADTSVVSIPAALPEGAEFGGLQVGGLGAGATVDALEGVIEDGVMERQQPLVRPVDVQIQQGIDVDSETGAVTENPVVITPDSVALVSSEFSLPSGISTVFPFSIPWDVLRVYQALDAEPAFPEIHASLYVPYSSAINPDYVDDKIPFTIGIPEDMKAGFDAFAAKFRAIALLVACIAVTWAMAKFIRW